VLSRRGASLVELLVAIALGALVLGSAAGGLLRQQRAAGWVGALAGGEGQMRPISQVVRGDLGALDPSSFDVATGEATDTSLQMRAVIGASVVCDTTGGAVTLAPVETVGVSLVGFAAAPVAGDTVWHYPSDSAGWLPRQVTGAASVNVPCPSLGLTGQGARLVLSGAGGMAPATPVRLTRPLRTVVYRATDRRWYLGMRDWSAASGRFAPPQPVAGPFVRTAPDGRRTGFRYFDERGQELASPIADASRIARVRITSVVAASSAAGGPLLFDSVDVTLRGRRAP
jgi:hypothetical protein